MKRSLTILSLGLILLDSFVPTAKAAPPYIANTDVTCEILVVGGGLAGAATAYEALLAGRTVCLTEITDWVGGQISSQGTSALDESKPQRERLYFSRGYLDLRQRIERQYGQLNPGKCWVSLSCFIPSDASKIVSAMLKDAANRGGATLKWFPKRRLLPPNITRNVSQLVDIPGWLGNTSCAEWVCFSGSSQEAIAFSHLPRFCGYCPVCDRLPPLYGTKSARTSW